jgi:ABC-type bacteriocin/lantibiotic exporter with double-glycine peptidase domain
LVLETDTILTFKLGQIVRLDGNSGHGKSTFSDIINGIIPFGEYTGTIYLDRAIKIPGFDVITRSRYYNEQSESISWKPSVYEIVTGKTIHMNKEFGPVETNELDEDIVWEALTICSCLDFLKRDNVFGDSKWIYSRNIGLSGGQKGRVALARSIYRVITTCPKIVTLDEVDKAIQSELVVGIMQNIYKYARTNNILMFVICHNSDVGKLNEYDQLINFNKGVIGLG